MPTLAPPAADAAHLAADVAAGRNWRANRRAIGLRQPGAAEVLDRCELARAWATARDGSVSARDADGRWFADCSVPRLAGRALLRTLAVEAGGNVLLAPAHAGLVAAARERLGAGNVLFVIHPDATVVRTILGCEDFADDLATGRLWLATGPAWVDALLAAFTDHPGLATPGRFVRTRLTADEAVDPLVAEAQRVFSTVATARAAELQRLHATPAVGGGRPLVIAGSRFRLWDDDAASALAALPGAVRFDADEPLSASPLALARAAEGCSAVVAVNAGRADGGLAVRRDVPWITWATVGAVPSAEAAGPSDRVIVADPAWTTAASDAGWPADRVAVGRCPTRLAAAVPPRPAVAVVADVGPIELPDAVRRFSTHQLLWEAIEAELHDRPWAAADPAAYLADRGAAMAVDIGSVDRVSFLTALVLPAYLHGVARALIGGGLPVHLWGTGWDGLPEFADRARGAVTGADHLADIADASTVLVKPTPGRGWHPVEACGRPVLHGTTADLVSRAKRLLARGVADAGSAEPTFAAAIAAALGTTAR